LVSDLDLFKKRLVINTVKHRVYNLICECPGIHFRDVQRRTATATGTLTYNLDCLVKTGILKTVRDGEYLRYYSCKELSADEKEIIELMRRKSVRHILLFLFENNTNNNEKLSKILDLSPSTISWHIKKLVCAGILKESVVGRKTFYSINNPELIGRVLIQYKESFMDKLVDRFAEMWES
jgi:predicted transcriptional regulator